MYLLTKEIRAGVANLITKLKPVDAALSDYYVALYEYETQPESGGQTIAYSHVEIAKIKIGDAFIALADNDFSETNA